MITVLAGGVGGAKFLKGLTHLVDGKELTIIVNTGDDIDIYGLRVSPDIDTITYRLSDLVDKKKGWGIENDTHTCLDMLEKLGYETWFRLGDKDFAVQIFKNELRQHGLTLSEITEKVCKKLGLKDLSIKPMTDEKVETWIKTEKETVHFQQYYIKYSMKPEVKGIIFKGNTEAKPAPGVVNAILNSSIIIISPSNPIISIGPILEIREIKEALIKTKAKVIAISPLVGGKPLKGPADKLMKGLGMEVSSTQIAKIYRDFLDIMVIDNTDKEEAKRIENLGIKTLVTDTIMDNDNKSIKLSRTILRFLASL